MTKFEFLKRCKGLGFVGEYNAHPSGHSHVFSTPKYIIEYEKEGVNGKRWAVYRRDEDSYCLAESLSEAVEDLCGRLKGEAYMLERKVRRDTGTVWLDEYVSMTYTRNGSTLNLYEGDLGTAVYGAGYWSEKEIAIFGLAWHLYRTPT